MDGERDRDAGKRDETEERVRAVLSEADLLYKEHGVGICIHCRKTEEESDKETNQGTYDLMGQRTIKKEDIYG